jgi:hypothetical protein
LTVEVVIPARARKELKLQFALSFAVITASAAAANALHFIV